MYRLRPQSHSELREAYEKCKRSSHKPRALVCSLHLARCFSIYVFTGIGGLSNFEYKKKSYQFHIFNWLASVWTTMWPWQTANSLLIFQLTRFDSSDSISACMLNALLDFQRAGCPSDSSGDSISRQGGFHSLSDTFLFIHVVYPTPCGRTWSCQALLVVGWVLHAAFLRCSSVCMACNVW